ncbi:MAG: protein kinase domain-containing protein [Stenotrophomonas sp.]|uniref:protein kinase domain-containing protein n=1 Tax=Stenotrophomonas sp. TaxID=69392 RepID=UPI003D6CA6EF
MTQNVLYCWTFADVELDEARWQLSIRGNPVELEHKPLGVLQYLLRHSGEVVTKQELIEEVWNGRVVVEAVLTNAIGKLRRALGDMADLVATVPRVGYRLEAAVRRRQVEFLPKASLLAAGDRVPRRPHWCLEQMLARRDDGEVWLSRHVKTDQLRVFKFSLDGRRLPSLKREVTVSRLLERAQGANPGRVKVIDWDFEQLPCFVELEYGGISLDQCQPALNELPLAERLELFIGAVDVVAAAHAVGVLHRDLKPANLLMREEPEGRRLCVADFGSSVFEHGALDALGISRLGLTASVNSTVDGGTPLYLAPEVVAGAAPTIKSDIYALGVTLYQLVVGDFRRPLSAGWEADITDPLLRQDIALAANGDPQRRFTSAAEFASSLRQLEQRHEQDAVQALVRERIAVAERRAVLARNRRPWLLASLALLASGALASSVMWWRAEQQREVAQQQAARADGVVRFLSNDLIGAINPGGSSYERTPTIKDMLDYASEHADQRFPDDAATRGTLHAALGGSWRTLGDRDRSEVHLRAAVRDYSQAFGEDSEPALKARYDLVSTLSYSQKFDEAGELLEQSDAKARAHLVDGDGVAFAAALARSMWNVQQQRLEPAEKALKQAEQLRQQLYPDDVLSAAKLRINLSDIILRQGRPQEVMDMLRATLADEAYDSGRIGDIYVSALRLNLARALRNLGRNDEALPLAKAAAETSERVLGPNQYQTLVQLSAVANIHSLSGDCPSGLQVMRTVRQRMADHFGADKQATLVETGNLADMEYECGDRQAGIDYLLRAERSLREHHGGDGNVHAQVFRFNRAQMLLDMKRYPEALQALEGLDPALLMAGDSRRGWEHRLAAVRGQALLLEGKTAEGHALLAKAVPELIALGSEDQDMIRELTTLMKSAP